jgi:hypothetical protein
MKLKDDSEIDRNQRIYYFQQPPHRREQDDCQEALGDSTGGEWRDHLGSYYTAHGPQANG